jgi:sortase A
MKKNKKTKILRILSSILIFLSILFLGLIFYPIAVQEVTYKVNETLGVKYTVNETKKAKEKKLVPSNTDFSIIIPKIAAVAPVISEVDYTNSDIFLKVLKKGVAHAKGTAYPDQVGNVYIFAHSTDAFYNVGNFNAVFYLLGKLNKGDEVVLYYKGNKYTYSVSEVKVVSKDDSYYLGKISEGKTLTLQTCYPPGTTLKRLVVIANFKE